MRHFLPLGLGFMIVLVALLGGVERSLARSYRLVGVLTSVRDNYVLDPCYPQAPAVREMRQQYIAVSEAGQSGHPNPWVLRVQDALKAPDQASVAGSDDLSIYFANLAYACPSATQEQRDSWAQMAREFGGDGGPVEVQQLLGLYYVQQREWDAALDVYGTLSERADADSDTFVWLGIVYRGLGRHAEALHALEQALARPDADVAEVLTLMGHSYLRLGDVDRALTLLSQAEARLTPDADLQSAQTYYFKGLALEQAGRPDAAVGAFEQALSASPDHAGAVLKLARYAVDRGDFALADGYLDRLSPADREGRQALCLRFAAKSGLGRHAEAEQLQQAIDDQQIRCAAGLMPELTE